MDKPNGKLTNIELQMMIDDMKRTLPFMIEFWKNDAKSMYARRKSLIEVGFTEKEALEIIKARGSQI
ncbi:hypothetical protein [Bacillus sp. S/N-304-OC-R1]|uniref:hypothetical protein n=1 Tax=Bacillus sp. S/N-304-OC-R1 TaxID=2758034 RepID=UPI001C8DBD29|nr:hypothetical protein [Bacillus sp. S/N-304-OC-R1]MBY0122175.1 hypothetical protein [Bacillus sp. S/N-304-OC-R1]